MTVRKPKCPECKSSDVKRNGCPKVWIGRKKYTVQNWQCNSCGRQFRYPRLGKGLKDD